MADNLVTLAQVVAAGPAAARVLYRHRLDFCCGGQQTLGDACAEAGLNPGTVLEEIERESASTAPVRVPTDPAQLVDHILDRYHRPLRPELVRLLEMAQKVERVHAQKPTCPTGLTAHLFEMQQAIEEHLTKEEQILFPMIQAGQGHRAYMPVQVMMQEHLDHAANLRRMRELTGDLRIPAEACATWRALYEGLAALELDLMEHIHLENNVLFPGVLAR
ncbi:MAG TPA: iron-sulfur cluster repair di-iron protein [Candidatus Acidoferrales bacterium]|nr:iron-sulfur cluster repair di-iron protein [Candidatus Acidoferrales bacterium]